MADFITLPGFTPEMNNSFLDSLPMNPGRDFNKELPGLYKKLPVFKEREIRYDSREGFNTCGSCKKKGKWLELPKEEGQKEYLLCMHCGNVSHY